MTMRKLKYDAESIREAAKSSKSLRQLISALGGNPNGSEIYRFIKRKIVENSIDISHFLGLASNRGKTSWNKLPPSERLIYRTSGARVSTKYLRNALNEIGREYSCSKCGLSKWMGKELTLQIDHLNGNPIDDRAENLAYICPNCHSQTPTWGNKKRSVGQLRGATTLSRWT